MARRRNPAPKSKCFSGKARFSTPGRARRKLGEIAATNRQSAAPVDQEPRAWYRCVHCGWIHLTRAEPADDSLVSVGRSSRDGREATGPT